MGWSKLRSQDRLAVAIAAMHELLSVNQVISKRKWAEVTDSEKLKGFSLGNGNRLWNGNRNGGRHRDGDGDGDDQELVGLEEDGLEAKVEGKGLGEEHGKENRLSIYHGFRRT